MSVVNPMPGLRPTTLALAEQMHADGVPYRKIGRHRRPKATSIRVDQPYVVSGIRNCLGAQSVAITRLVRVTRRAVEI
jgi:hypothetical protein